MADVTGQVQGSTSNLSDAERRRRLASVYRLLIELGQREGAASEKCQVEQEKTAGHLIWPESLPD